MQPIQISEFPCRLKTVGYCTCTCTGVNAAVVLVVLLLAVPLQLFLSHYLSQVYSSTSHTSVEFKGPSKLGPSGERAAIDSGMGSSETKGIQAARLQAVNQ